MHAQKIGCTSEVLCNQAHSIGIGCAIYPGLRQMGLLCSVLCVKTSIFFFKRWALFLGTMFFEHRLFTLNFSFLTVFDNTVKLKVPKSSNYCHFWAVFLEKTEIEIVISLLDFKKSVGPNIIPTKVLKLCKNNIFSQLSEIFSIFLL